MYTVVLAAGQSLRLKPIEDKNFLNFLGKPLLQHQLEQLVNLGLKGIVVVARGHNLDRVKKLANQFQGVQVVEQKDLEGMAGAVLVAGKPVKKGEPILIVNANDVLPDEAFLKILKEVKAERGADGFLLGKKVARYFPGGYLKMQKNGLIQSIIEKPGEGNEPSDLVNIVVHYHRDGQKFLEVLGKTSSKRDDRYEAALDSLLRKGAPYKAVIHNGSWKAFKYPWHILEIMEHFLERIPEFKKSSIKNKQVEIAPTAIVRGKVWLEEGVRLLDHAAVVGPAYIGRNTIIATNALVRGSQLGENCVIGFGSEIARSYLGNNVWTHTNYIGDSIIGNDVSFGAGCVTGNLRLDERNIAVEIRGEKIDSGRTKFGLITGDHVRCGINTSFMPGVKIGHNSFVGAGLTLAQDVEDGKYVYGKTELIVKENKANLAEGSRKNMKKKI